MEFTSPPATTQSNENKVFAVLNWKSHHILNPLTVFNCNSHSSVAASLAFFCDDDDDDDDAPGLICLGKCERRLNACVFPPICVQKLVKEVGRCSSGTTTSTVSSHTEAAHNHMGWRSYSSYNITNTTRLQKQHRPQLPNSQISVPKCWIILAQWHTWQRHILYWISL